MVNEFLKDLAKFDKYDAKMEDQYLSQIFARTKRSKASKQQRLKEVLKRLKAVRQKQNLKQLLGRRKRYEKKNGL